MPATACAWLRSSPSASRTIADSVLTVRRSFAVEVAVPLVRLLRRRLPMVARDQRDDLDLLRLEAAQVAILDQVVRMPVMPLVADVDADVVQQRAVLQPLALAVAEACARCASGRRC